MVASRNSRAGLDLHAMLGKKLTLQTALADRTLSPRSGIVTGATSDEAVSAHLAQSPFLGSGAARSYTVQYRETDLAFVTRLLAEEGIGWRIEQDGEGAAASPCGHTLVLFADSVGAGSCPEDASSKSSNGPRHGIRFHRASSQETSDAIQAFGGQRVLQAATTTVLGWDYKAKRSVAASVPTNHAFGGANAPRLEAYDRPAAPSATARPPTWPRQRPRSTR